MKIEFSNKWYRSECENNGLNPDNSESQTEVTLAKFHSKKLKFWLDNYETLPKQYPDHWHEIKPKIEHQIKLHNEKRIEHMLNALKIAEKKGKVNVS